jgi:rare lipoprotein A
MLRDGTAMVEVRSIDAGAPPSVPVPVPMPATAPTITTMAAVAPATTGTSLIATADAAPVTAAPDAADAPEASATAAATAAVGAAPAAATSAAVSAAKPVLFVQAGAFADPANAARLAAKLRGGDYGRIFVRDDVIAGRRMYRVRIGPVADVQSFDRIYEALERDGVHDAHLAMD